MKRMRARKKPEKMSPHFRRFLLRTPADARRHGHVVHFALPSRSTSFSVQRSCAILRPQRRPSVPHRFAEETWGGGERERECCAFVCLQKRERERQRNKAKEKVIDFGRASERERGKELRGRAACVRGWVEGQRVVRVCVSFLGFFGFLSFLQFAHTFDEVPIKARLYWVELVNFRRAPNARAWSDLGR